VLAQDVCSNTLAMLEIMVISASSWLESCREAHTCLAWIRRRNHFGIGDPRDYLLARTPRASV
jgi:hypothetical protein